MQNESSQFLNVTSSLTESDGYSPDIEKLLRKAEFENSERVKLIEAEKQRYKALQSQLEEKSRCTEELEKSTKQLDKEAKVLHQQFKQNREICESLKKTNDILNEHEEALQTKIEELRCTIQQQKMQHQEVLKKYQNTWQSYHKIYESGEYAMQLQTTKGNSNKLKEEVRMIDDKINYLKEGISKLEMEKNKMQETKDKGLTSAIPAIIKLADLYQDGRNKIKLLKQVNNNIQQAKEKQLQLSENKAAGEIWSTQEDNQVPCEYAEPQVMMTHVTQQENLEVATTDKSTISTLGNMIPPAPVPNEFQVHSPQNTPSPSKPSGNSLERDSVNQQHQTVGNTSLPGQQIPAETSVNNGQQLLSPQRQISNQNSSSIHADTPLGFSNTTPASQMSPAHLISAEHNTASHSTRSPLHLAGYSPSYQLQNTMAQQEKDGEVITTSSAPELMNSDEYNGVQNPVSPGPSVGAGEAAKSPFSFTVHTERVQQLTKSPGEGFLFHGRPMFQASGGTEEKDKSNEPQSDFFQPFFGASQQGQTFANSTSSMFSTSVQNDSGSSDGSAGFFSAPNASSPKGTLNLFGSPSFQSQANSGIFAGSKSPPALFPMFDHTSSESQPSGSQHLSPSNFSLNFGSAAVSESESGKRPLFSLF